MKKKINYSQWLKSRTGKSLWDLCEEGKTISEILTFASGNGLIIPKKYVSNYKKYWKQKKSENGEFKKEEQEVKREENVEEVKVEKEVKEDKTIFGKSDLFSNLSKILDKLIALGEGKIAEGDIMLTASDLIRAIELRKELGEEGENVQETVDRILGRSKE